MAVVKELFSAYSKSELPSDGGYIVSAFFDSNSTYSKYELTSYNNVKDIYQNTEDLTFQADGKKMFIIVEPANYAKKYTEPAYRDDAHKIPYRFNEVETIVSRRQDRIMIGKKPIITYTSFTILKSQGHNFSYIFYPTDDIVNVMEKFFVDTIWRDTNVPKIDAEKAGRFVKKIFKDFIDYKIE